MRSIASRNWSRLYTPRRSIATFSAYTRASQSAWNGGSSGSTRTAPKPDCPPTSFTRAMRAA
jgi:hypothetical protein